MSTFVDVLDGGKTGEEGAHRAISKLISTFGVLDATSLKASQRAAGANRSVDIAVGDAFIAYLNYHYHVWVSAIENVVIDTNTSGLARIDTIVGYVDKSVISSASSNNPATLKFVAVKGTPNASPSAPSQATIEAQIGASNPYIHICNVAVANGFSSILDANITDRRTIMNFDLTKLLRNDTGWRYMPYTFTRSSNLVMTVGSAANPIDLSGILVKGSCFKLTDTTTKYFYVESAVYSGGVTTITFMTTTTNVLVGNPTAVYYSNVTPVDMPWLAFTPSFTGFSSNPTVTAKYYIIGRLMTVKYYTTANGTSNATTFTITLPTTTENVADLFFGSLAYVVDNGASFYGSYFLAQNSNIATIYKQTAGAFTNSGVKQFTGVIQANI